MEGPTKGAREVTFQHAAEAKGANSVLGCMVWRERDRDGRAGVLGLGRVGVPRAAFFACWANAAGKALRACLDIALLHGSGAGQAADPAGRRQCQPRPTRLVPGAVPVLSATLAKLA